MQHLCDFIFDVVRPPSFPMAATTPSFQQQQQQRRQQQQQYIGTILRQFRRLERLEDEE